MKTKKYTWEMIRHDFSKAYPELSKKSNYWHPHDFMQIVVNLNDGRTVIFDDVHKTIKYIEPWKHELRKELEANKKN